MVPHRDHGWEWVNEGTDSSPKWGFVSKTPSSVLKVGTCAVAAAETTCWNCQQLDWQTPLNRLMHKAYMLPLLCRARRQDDQTC